MSSESQNLFGKSAEELGLDGQPDLAARSEVDGQGENEEILTTSPSNKEIRVGDFLTKIDQLLKQKLTAIGMQKGAIAATIVFLQDKLSPYLYDNEYDTKSFPDTDELISDIKTHTSTFEINARALATEILGLLSTAQQLEVTAPADAPMVSNTPAATTAAESDPPIATPSEPLVNPIVSELPDAEVPPTSSEIKASVPFTTTYEDIKVFINNLNFKSLAASEAFTLKIKKDINNTSSNKAIKLFNDLLSGWKSFNLTSTGILENPANYQTYNLKENLYRSFNNIIGGSADSLQLVERNIVRQLAAVVEQELIKKHHPGSADTVKPIAVGTTDTAPSIATPMEPVVPPADTVEVVPETDDEVDIYEDAIALLDDILPTDVEFDEHSKEKLAEILLDYYDDYNTLEEFLGAIDDFKADHDYLPELKDEDARTTLFDEIKDKFSDNEYWRNTTASSVHAVPIPHSADSRGGGSTNQEKHWARQVRDNLDADMERLVRAKDKVKSGLRSLWSRGRAKLGEIIPVVKKQNEIKKDRDGQYETLNSLLTADMTASKEAKTRGEATPVSAIVAKLEARVGEFREATKDLDRSTDNYLVNKAHKILDDLTFDIANGRALREYKLSQLVIIMNRMNVDLKPDDNGKLPKRDENQVEAELGQVVSKQAAAEMRMLQKLGRVLEPWKSLADISKSAKQKWSEDRVGFLLRVAGGVTGAAWSEGQKALMKDSGLWGYVNPATISFLMYGAQYIGTVGYNSENKLFKTIANKIQDAAQFAYEKRIFEVTDAMTVGFLADKTANFMLQAGGVSDFFTGSGEPDAAVSSESRSSDSIGQPTGESIQTPGGVVAPESPAHTVDAPETVLNTQLRNFDTAVTPDFHFDKDSGSLVETTTALVGLEGRPVHGDATFTDNFKTFFHEVFIDDSGNQIVTEHGPTSLEGIREAVARQMGVDVSQLNSVEFNTEPVVNILGSDATPAQVEAYAAAHGLEIKDLYGQSDAPPNSGPSSTTFQMSGEQYAQMIHNHVVDLGLDDATSSDPNISPTAPHGSFPSDNVDGKFANHNEASGGDTNKIIFPIITNGTAAGQPNNPIDGDEYGVPPDSHVVTQNGKPVNPIDGDEYGVPPDSHVVTQNGEPVNPMDTDAYGVPPDSHVVTQNGEPVNPMDTDAYGVPPDSHVVTQNGKPVDSDDYGVKPDSSILDTDYTVVSERTFDLEKMRPDNGFDKDHIWHHSLSAVQEVFPADTDNLQGKADPGKDIARAINLGLGFNDDPGRGADVIMLEGVYSIEELQAVAKQAHELEATLGPDHHISLVPTNEQMENIAKALQTALEKPFDDRTSGEKILTSLIGGTGYGQLITAEELADHPDNFSAVLHFMFDEEHDSSIANYLPIVNNGETNTLSEVQATEDAQSLANTARPDAEVENGPVAPVSPALEVPEQTTTVVETPTTVTATSSTTPDATHTIVSTAEAPATATIISTAEAPATATIISTQKPQAADEISRDLIDSHFSGVYLGRHREESINTIVYVADHAAVPGNSTAEKIDRLVANGQADRIVQFVDKSVGGDELSSSIWVKVIENAAEGKLEPLTVSGTFDGKDLFIGTLTPEHQQDLLTKMIESTDDVNAQSAALSRQAITGLWGNNFDNFSDENKATVTDLFRQLQTDSAPTIVDPATNIAIDQARVDEVWKDVPESVRYGQMPSDTEIMYFVLRLIGIFR